MPCVSRVLAVVVTFHPEAKQLAPLLRRLHGQTEQVLVVDNTPKESELVWPIAEPLLAERLNLRVVRLGRNAGIAAAFNVGMDIAASEGFTHVLLSDQDSLPMPNMVAGLLDAERHNASLGAKVAAVGPVYIDRVTGHRFPFQVQVPGTLFYRRMQVSTAHPDIQTISLISSGTLINAEALASVGKMREDLFIDHVDVEWCHRAIARGYVLIGTDRARMEHNMGDDCLRVWVFGWRNINGYGPNRLYYRFRNLIALMRLDYVPTRWKLRVAVFWLGEFYAHAFFGSKRNANIRAMVTGLRDGLRNRMGVRP